MTRSIFVATLLLTPALLHAQATSPAQTASQTASQNAPSNLQARIMPVSDIKAADKAAPTTTTASTTRRVSTGIIAPRLVDTLSFDASNRHFTASKQATVVLTMTVDATGKAESLAVAESAGKELDEKVLAALSQARFQAGTLDGQPYPLPLRLKVVVPQGTEY